MQVTTTTEGIKISVKTEYRSDFSNPQNSNYLFVYSITIENNSTNVVQLLKRKWHIFDSMGTHREVIGDGVVGQKPILYPGEFHSYESACPLNSAFGKMHGTYLMQRIDTGEQFDVKIPSFDLVATFRMN